MTDTFISRGFFHTNENSKLDLNLSKWLKKQLTYLGVYFTDPCCPSTTPPPSTITNLTLPYLNLGTGTITLTDQHYTVLGDVGSVVNLPSANSCVGRIYVLKQIGTINTFGSDQNEATILYPSYAGMTFTIQSAGSGSWILLNVF